MFRVIHDWLGKQEDVETALEAVALAVEWLPTLPEGEEKDAIRELAIDGRTMLCPPGEQAKTVATNEVTIFDLDIWPPNENDEIEW